MSKFRSGAHDLGQLALESLDDALHIVDRDMVIQYANPALDVWLKRMGLDPEPAGKKLLDCFTFLTKDVLKEYEKVLSERKVIVSQEMHQIDDSEVFVEIRRIPILKGRRVNWVLTLIRDITEPQRIERLLMESEKKFRTAFEESPIAMEVFDSEGRILDINQAGLDLFGVPSNEDMKGFVLFEDPNTPEDVKEKLLAGEAARFMLEFDFEKTRQAGQYTTTKTGLMHIDVLHTPLRLDETGDITGYFSQIQDVTERTETVAALRESQESLDLALQGAELGIWHWDARTGEMTFSSRWATILGYDLDDLEMTIEGWEKLVHPDDLEEVVARWNMHVAGESPLYSSEHRMKTKSEEWKWVLERGKVVEWEEDGSTQQATGTLLDITHLKETEKDLRESEERYRTIFDSAVDGIHVIDRDGNTSSANARMCEMMGVSLDEIMTMNIVDFMPEDARQYAMEQFERIISGETDTVEGIPMMRSDGVLFFADIKSTPITLDGVPHRLGFIRDVTEQKKVAEAIRESEQKHRTVIESMHDLIFVYDKEDKYRECYASSGHLLVQPAEEMMEKHVADTIPEDVADKHLALSREVRNTKEPRTFDYPLVIEDRQYWFSATLSLHDDGESIVSVVRDITDRHEAEEAVRYLAEFEEIVSELATRFIDLPIEEIDREINSALNRIGEFVGAVLGSVILFSDDLSTLTNTHEWADSPEDSQIANLQGIPSATFGYYFETLHRGDSIIISTREENPPEAIGERRWAQSLGIPFRSQLLVPMTHEGALYGVLGFYGARGTEHLWPEQLGHLLRLVAAVFVSALERKRAEEELRFSNRELEMYANLLQHDIRNDLQVVYNSTEFAFMTIEDIPKTKGNLEAIAAATERMTKLLDVLGRPSALEERDIIRILQLASRQAEKSHPGLNVELRLRSVGPELRVLGGRLMTTVFDNLFRNSAEYAGPDAEVTVVVSPSEKGVQIDVSDKGPGIPKEIRESLFQKGTSTTGGGYGLFLTKKIIEVYGGTIELLDSAKHGASFRIILPVARVRA
ncbi:MAG: PAS domain S-box protein [Candidatus Thorarchaeota archaeon]|nr:MAG: PAS domain S-box protein [Candidatus Thorarchaeota archaeon]